MKYFESQLTEKERNEGLQLFRVWEVHKEQYKLALLSDVSGAGKKNAVLKGSVFYQNAGLKDYPAIGDVVVAMKNPQGDNIIYRVLTRKSQFVRLSAGSVGAHSDNTARQVVAANFDTVFLMESLNQDFNVRKMERYLLPAWESGGTPVIVLTKADLCIEVEEKVQEMRNIAPGVEVYAVSAKDNVGMKALEKYLASGKVVAVCGSSGIGKSTLINALAGKEVMATSAIREEDDKGRHTTTHRQVISLPNGALMIDTPGMRELGLWSTGEGVENSFEDVLSLVARCRFSDCKHESEPGCAVRAALDSGELSAERFASFKKLEREANRSAKKEMIRQQKTAYKKACRKEHLGKR